MVRIVGNLDELGYIEVQLERTAHENIKSDEEVFKPFKVDFKLV